MRDFFKPWRRKIGVVTLGLACGFMAGWVRSIGTADRFIFQYTFTLQYVESRSGRIGWSSSDNGSKLSLKWESFEPSSYSFHESYDPEEFEIQNRRFRRLLAERGMIEVGSSSWKVWRWGRAGFSYGVNKRQGLWTSRYCVVPYWSIVIPLTLLSAWLLLSKPRPPAPKQSTEPAPTTGDSHA